MSIISLPNSSYSNPKVSKSSTSEYDEFHTFKFGKFDKDMIENLKKKNYIRLFME